MPIDGIRFRRHLLMGYRLRSDLSQADLEDIKVYIETGDPSYLPERYHRLREKLRSNPELGRRIDPTRSESNGP